MKRKSDEADLHAAGQQDLEEFQDAGSSSVDDEEEDEEIKKPAKIRNVTKKKQTKGPGIIGAVKLSKRELYKPPTNEELNQLKETENLFHSTLLRMQIEELLKEVKVKEKKRKVIETFLHEVKNLLSNIPETEQVDITDQSWLPKGVKVPFLQIPYNIKGKFHFLRPASVKVIGSYLLGTCTKPEINVDVAVTMPAEILQAKDNLNQRYLRKRALYLAHIACHLSKNKIFGCVKFGYFNSNHLKPILYLSPQGDDEKLVTIRLHPCAPASLFKFTRFHPSKNNIRVSWFMEHGSAPEGIDEPPTPHYNNAILVDLVMEKHLRFLSNAATDFPGMKDGIQILKVWLHQRELTKGYGCFNGFLVSMLVAYLRSKRKLNKMMSGYQVLRNVLQFLAVTDLTRDGISLSQGTDDFMPSLPDFHQAFEVVFVDPSGFVNLCAEMTASKYKQIQHEAQMSMEILSNKTVDGFEMLLMTPKPLIQTFDHVFHLKNLVKLQEGCKKMKLLSGLIDHGGNYIVTILPHLLSLLTSGLGQRIHLLTHSLLQIPEWPISSDPPKHKDSRNLSFGILLNPPVSTNVLEKGPPADSPEAAEFRDFWGENSELRRFQDGSICEAVLWQGDSIRDRRLIPEQIIQHLLKLHVDLPKSSLCYVGGLLDSVIELEKGRSGSEEKTISVVQSYDDLSRKLWNLSGLPLNVTSVQGTHPVFRFTEVFPPVPVKPDFSYYVKDKNSKCLLPSTDKPSPVYVPALKVICHMEGSGKWPQNKDAIQRVKAAFHIRLADLLHQQHQLTSQLSSTHVDVYKDGYVFRVQVGYHREPLILKEIHTPDGMLKYRDTEESLQLELETVHLPYLTSTLHGLQQQHSAYSGTCRLAKRWISAQLLSNDIGEESIDLLAAYLFTQTAPYTPPASLQTGFLRFLNLLSTFDWKNNPLIVNLNGDIKETEYTEIKNDFVATRSQRPVMFVATPNDRTSSIWTKGRPSAPILQRLTELASQSLRTLATQLMDPLDNHDLKMVFRPPLDIYDVIIHLNPKHVPRHLEAVDRPKVTYNRGTLRNDAAVKFFKMPVVGYDPVQCYLHELRNAFGEFALFFYDNHGGCLIAVLWKPHAFTPQPFKTSHINAKMLETKENELQMIPNVEAIMEDFEILGAGLVKSVEALTEKWKI
ncbi:nucleolar protein 6 [Scyliorhinus canicula]|uniref:nucleolar protein 6 n=1 Tax=Scyliorhinus canicula TaxID=7830 RepID=UPI0018F518E0|nr:nucleolar protein 6 [Scyliorhinus canicula]